MTEMKGSLGLLLPLVLFAASLACGREQRERAKRWTGGDPSRGETAIRHFGCSSCHTIPGIRGADGLVGPPLDRIAGRLYIAGSVPNTPQNLMRFLAHPHGPHPTTAMPEMQIPERDIRDIAAYLYTLR
jgi:cytochrome c